MINSERNSIDSFDHVKFGMNTIEISGKKKISNSTLLNLFDEP